MTTRSLTEVFILMRNNAMQNRHIYNEQRVTDEVALVENTEDVELGRVPPAWTSAAEETQYIAVRLRSKMDSLRELHRRIISRPTFDESTADEKQIESMAHEISRMFSSGHRLISQVKNEGSFGKTAEERRLAESVSSALLASLQTLSTEFKAIQSNYLNKIRSREERSRPYFEVELGSGDASNEVWLDDGDASQLVSLYSPVTVDLSKEREREVQSIVESILELNQLFRGVSTLITDQGTVLDRIDYMLETTQIQVSQGTRQLAKAAAYQKASKKMMCILILAGVTTVMTCLLIITKL